MFSSRFFNRAVRFASRFRSNSNNSSNSFIKFGTIATGVAICTFSNVLCNTDQIQQVPLCSFDEVPEGGMKKVQVGNNEDNFVLVSKVNNTIYVTGGRCSHYGAPLQMGYLDGYAVICPWHAAAFDVRTGEMVQSPGLNPIPTYNFSIVDGKVVAHIPESKINSVAESSRSKKLAKRDPANNYSIVVVGGGAAGSTAVETLRKEGFTGRIVLVSAESLLPYDRVVLSKSFKANGADLQFRSREFYNEFGIELELGAQVTSIDSNHKQVRLANGKVLAYDKLLLATGAEAKVPGPFRNYTKNFSNVFTLRSAADHDKLKGEVAKAQDVVIVGSGFIGLESAKAIKSAWPDKNVTVIAVEERPMAPILGNEIAEQLITSQKLNGINLLTNQEISSFEGSNGRVERVVIPTRKNFAMPLSTSDIKADIVILATGSQLNTLYIPNELVNPDGSVKVNSHLQSEDPSIWAAGDIAQFPSLLSESRERVEHWAVAEQQGRLAALNMLEKGNNYLDVPFFWSNQFLNIQFAGFSGGHNWTYTESKGEVGAEKTARITYFFKDQRCIGVAAVNWPGAILRLKIALQRGLMPSRRELTDKKANFETILEKVKHSNPCGGNCCRN